MATAYVEIPLHGKKAAGRVALVDLDDYEIVSKYRWFVQERQRPGRMPDGPYAIAHTYRNGKRVTVKMHRLLLDCPLVDHKDHDGLNNRRGNLRDGTRGNVHNQRPSGRGSSVYKGVTWNEADKRWRARISPNRVTVYLGSFINEEDAARAYDAAALRLFGEFACVNFLVDDIHEGGEISPA